MTPLKEGDKAPYFEGINQDVKKITLDDFKGKKFMFTFILAVMMIPTQVTALRKTTRQDARLKHVV